MTLIRLRPEHAVWSRLSSLLFILFLLAPKTPAKADGPTPVRAPLNPAFVHYFEKQKDERSAQKTSGHCFQEGENSYCKGLIPSPVPPEIHKPGHDYGPVRMRRNGASATDPQYDLRDPNLDGNDSDSLLTPVRNQGQCGVCYAFAVYGTLESRLKHRFSLPDDQNDYSENNLKHLHGFSTGGPCNGGNIDMSMAYMARYDGPISESDDPYEEQGTTFCTDCKPVRYVDNLVELPVRSSTIDLTYIKETIIAHGALYSSMLWDESYYRESDYTYYCGLDPNSQHPPIPTDHSIVIVGWDDEKNTPAGDADNLKGAFIVKNSYGQLWGENGYFYVSYYDLYIAFHDLAYFIDNDDSQLFFSKIYQHDPLGRTGLVTYGPDPAVAWAANVFIAEENADIIAVGFYSSGSGLSYQIYIYNNFTSFSPTPSLNTSGDVTYSGYYTVPLDTPIQIHAGDQFAVAVKFDNSASGIWPIPIEDDTNDTADAEASPGESYISADGLTYKDITTFGEEWEKTNVCIKAIVNSLSLEDAIAALKIVSGLTPTGEYSVKDINDDLKIGIEEAIYILQYLAGLR